MLGREWTPDLISTEMSHHVLCSDVIYVFPLDVGVPPCSESSPLPVPFVTHCILDGDPPPQSGSSLSYSCVEKLMPKVKALQVGSLGGD